MGLFRTLKKQKDYTPEYNSEMDEMAKQFGLWLGNKLSRKRGQIIDKLYDEFKNEAIKNIAHTFQNGKRSNEECIEMAKEYFNNLKTK